MKSHILYKLTDQDGYTRRGCRNETLWEPGYIYSAIGDPDNDLCSDGWIHAYQDPYLGLVLNPQHANIASPRLWLAQGTGKFKDDLGLKCGVRKLQIVQELPIPEITVSTKVHFAILCAQPVYKNASWNKWAENWISGKDRSHAASDAAASPYAANAAYASYAAYAAAYAASSAANAANAAASYAADAAVYAANAAASSLDFPGLIRQALKAEQQWNESTDLVKLYGKGKK